MLRYADLQVIHARTPLIPLFKRVFEKSATASQPPIYVSMPIFKDDKYKVNIPILFQTNGEIVFPRTSAFKCYRINE
jgi:hypothetical protein